MKKQWTKRLFQIAVIFVLNMLIINVVTYQTPEAVQTLSRPGSRGDEVTKIQTRLKDWGYYHDKVDGIYGTNTTKAVMEFQRKHGLAVDGIAGPATLEKIGISSSSSGNSQNQNSDSNLKLLARIISAEARGEPYTGQVAVGAVVLNRVAHPSFPDTISGVIYQPGAFTAVVDGNFQQPVSDSSYKAAQDALNGWDPSGGAIYYYNPNKTSNKWMLSRPVLKRIGDHLFCS